MKLLPFGVLAIILALGAWLVLSPPVTAADLPCVQTLEDVVAMIEESGGELIDLIDVPGNGFDQLIIADFDGTISIGRSLLGCAVGGPMIMGLSVERVSA